MSRITPLTAISFGALLALIAGFAFAAPAPRVGAATSVLRAEMACSPLTNSQRNTKPGDEQRCRIRIRNTDRNRYDAQGNLTYQAQPITGITYTRPTPNTLTSRSTSSALTTCDLTGCEPFTLQPGQQVIIIEDSTFNPYQDGRGKTQVTAPGTYNGYTVTGSGIEQTTLP